LFFLVVLSRVRVCVLLFNSCVLCVCVCVVCVRVRVRVCVLFVVSPYEQRIDSFATQRKTANSQRRTRPLNNDARPAQVIVSGITSVNRAIVNRDEKDNSKLLLFVEGTGLLRVRACVRGARVCVCVSFVCFSPKKRPVAVSHVHGPFVS
jgi:hypothetical protein